MAKKKTPKVEAPKEEQYVISVQIGTDKYQGSGATALEALQAIGTPKKLMNKGVITVTKGTQTKTHLMFPIRLKRLFYTSPTFQAIHAKSLSFGFK